MPEQARARATHCVVDVRVACGLCLTGTGCSQLFKLHSVLSLSCPVPDVAVLATVVDHQDLWIF